MQHLGRTQKEGQMNIKELETCTEDDLKNYNENIKKVSSMA